MAVAGRKSPGNVETQRRLRPRFPPALSVALAATALAIAGSAFGPWASVAGELHAGGQVERYQVGGLVGDGVFTLSLSAAAALLILWRVAKGHISGFLSGLAFVMLSLSAVMAMLNWVDIGNMPGVYVPGKYYHTDAQAAWGLVSTTFGAAAGAAATAYQIWSDELR